MTAQTRKQRRVGPQAASIGSRRFQQQQQELLAIVPYLPETSSGFKESDGKKFTCPANTVLTGQRHQNDENGNTKYQYSYMIPATNEISVGATSVSGAIKESSGTVFVCPDNTVLTGAMHEGDENGDSFYQYSALNFNGAQITTDEAQWSGWIKESSGDEFECPKNAVLTGREHKGDENGDTRYRYSYLLLGEQQLLVTNQRWSAEIKQPSGGWFRCPGNTVMTGRKHKGDENGDTTYQYAQVFFPAGPVITTGDEEWSSWKKASDERFVAPENKVITGRQHKGDENGDTRYQTSRVYYNGLETAVNVDDNWSRGIKESSGDWYYCPMNQVMVGRKHNGDENADSAYKSGSVVYLKNSSE